MYNSEDSDNESEMTYCPELSMQTDFRFVLYKASWM
jgi:hypothetical protein